MGVEFGALGVGPSPFPPHSKVVLVAVVETSILTKRRCSCLHSTLRGRSCQNSGFPGFPSIIKNMFRNAPPTPRPSS